MQLRYGILSTSSIAPRFIAAVREAGAGEIVAVSSRTLEKARQKAEQWSIPTAYGSHDALLGDERVNIVYISPVNSQHYPWAKAALLHGKHVICEKPCTTTAAQTAELYDLAAQKGLFFMEAQKMLFLPAIRQVQSRIAAGALGTIRKVEFIHSFSGSYNDWQFEPSLGGGTLLSSGIYMTELLVWLFGEMRSITGTRITKPNGAECAFTLTGQMKNGVGFHCRSTTLETLDSTARIVGDKGYAEVPQYWKARKAVFHFPGKEPETVEYPCEHELIYEAQHIAQCLQAGVLTSPVVTKDLSVQGIAALEQVKANWRD